MKILESQQIREWDQYTISHEPVSSIDLMERAAGQCVQWLEENKDGALSFSIFCGKGNNGGDGLAIARLLAGKNLSVRVHILEFGHKGTEDFQTNLARLHQYPGIEIRFIQAAEHLPLFARGEIILDALYGSGLNRPLEGVTAQLVDHINAAGETVISIDVPSGMMTDRSSRGFPIIRAAHTLTFQCFRLAFLVAENAAYTGQVHILPIGLHPAFYRDVTSAHELIDSSLIHSIYRPRESFAHKGNFGHALLVAGSYGKIGAAVLSAKACLRSGVGLLTCHVPGCGYEVMQVSVPEAMITTDFNSSYTTKIEDDLSRYKAVGIGPGIGTASETKQMLREILQQYFRPVILDADALNAIAANKELLDLIPAHSILTPHPKEFERLFGATDNDFEKILRARQKAKELNLVIVLKGHHTLIATPGGQTFFNSTGNAGMATGGSGDVLTGLLTGLLAQGYEPVEAALLGVYLHGLAGDIAANECSQEALIAGDLPGAFGKAFRRIDDR